MKKEQALQVLIQVAELAQLSGIIKTLGEAKTVVNAIDVLTIKKEPGQENEKVYADKLIMHKYNEEKNCKKEQALQVLIQVAELVQLSGIIKTLGEAKTVVNAIDVLTIKKEPGQENEKVYADKLIMHKYNEEKNCKKDEK